MDIKFQIKIGDKEFVLEESEVKELYKKLGEFLQQPSYYTIPLSNPGTWFPPTRWIYDNGPTCIANNVSHQSNSAN